MNDFSSRFARRMYDDRPSPAHTQEHRGPSATSAKQRPRPPQTADLEAKYLAKVARVQDLLRAATRNRGPAVATVFSDVASIRARFPRWSVTRHSRRGSDSSAARDAGLGPLASLSRTASPLFRLRR
jgi:hypothetical protein